MSEKEIYYVCKSCKSADESSCKMTCKFTADTIPGHPDQCPWDLGLKPHWRLEDKPPADMKEQ